MRHAAVDDVDRVHAILGGVQRRRDLGQHATRNRAVREQFVDGLGGQAAQQLAGLVQHARGVGQHQQLFGAQHFGHLAGDDVGVDVVGRAVFAIADGRDRSVKKDLETQIAIVTENQELKKSMHEECRKLYTLGLPATETRVIPKWVYAMVFFFRAYF